MQADSKYDVVRALLATTPAKGVQRYDFARSLVRACRACWGSRALCLLTPSADAYASASQFLKL